MSLGEGSAHGSGWGGSVSAAGGSNHGSAHGSVASVASVGAWVGGNTGGGGTSRRQSGSSSIGGGGGGGSRRPSGILLPWSQEDVGELRGGGDGDGDGDREGKGEVPKASDDMVEGFKRSVERVGRVFSAGGAGSRSTGNTPRGFGGGFSKGTPRGRGGAGGGFGRGNPHGGGSGVVSASGTPRGNDGADEGFKGRVGRAFTTAVGGSSSTAGTGTGGAALTTPRATLSLKEFSTPLSGPALRASTGLETYGTPRASALDFSGHGGPAAAGAAAAGAATHKRRFSAASELAAVTDTAAGYEAAMANWPAGKVEGNPAWEEWSPEKKLACHFVTAGCLAAIVCTW